MRAVQVVVWLGVLCSCVPTTVLTRRVALTPIPGAPSILAGGSGGDLTVRMLTGSPEPKAAGGALALPIAQPEVGAVLRIAEHTFTSAQLALAPAFFGVSSPPQAPAVPQNKVAFDASIGFGQDVIIVGPLGVTLATELGVKGVWLTTVTPLNSSDQFWLLPSGRAAAALYFNPGQLRIFAGVVAGLGTYNDLDGTETSSTCLLCGGHETGVLTSAIVGTAGGGLRWQANQHVALVAQAWVAFTANGTRLPVTASLGVRVGDLTAFRR